MDTTGKKQKKKSSTSGGASPSTGVRTAYQQVRGATLRFRENQLGPLRSNSLIQGFIDSMCTVFDSSCRCVNCSPPNALVIKRANPSLTAPPLLLFFTRPFPSHLRLACRALLPARDGRAEGAAPRLDGPRAPRGNVEALEGELAQKRRISFECYHALAAENSYTGRVPTSSPPHRPMRRTLRPRREVGFEGVSWWTFGTCVLKVFLACLSLYNNRRWAMFLLFCLTTA